jgi:hypothetical protein
LGATNGIDHGANGTFSICAGDMDDLALTKSDIQFRDESPDVFQAKLNPEALETVEPRKRLFVC